MLGVLFKPVGDPGSGLGHGANLVFQLGQVQFLGELTDHGPWLGAQAEEIVAGSWGGNQFGYGSVREHKVGPDEVLVKMEALSPRPTATVIVTDTALDWGASPHWKNLVIILLSADVNPTVLQELEESAQVGARIIGLESPGTPGD